MKNHFRLFSIFLCVILSFSFLSVNSFAAGEENLVSSDLRTWLPGSGVDSTLIDPYQFFYDEKNNFNRVNLEFPLIESTGLYMGNSILYELPEIQVSETYQFSFTFPSLKTIQTLFPHITDSISLQSFFGNSFLVIGVGFIDPSTNQFQVYDDCYFSFNTDDIPSTIGKTFTQTFNLKQIKGVPFFGICVTSSSQKCSFFIQDVSLFKVQSENDKKLDGILGWLQELWTSITGGFDRIQTKIGEVITNISGELQSVKEGITTKLGEVITNLSGVLNSVKEGITTKLGEVITGLTGELRYLGDRIINYLLYFSDEVPENPFEGVDSPLDDVQGFFDDLIDYLSNIGDDIETVIDSITGPVTLLDHFTKRFEWLFGIVTFTLMLIVVSRFIGL